MSLITTSVVAASTATQLFKSTVPAGNQVLITTHGNSADVRIGASNVTASANGVIVPKSSNLQITVPCGETLYVAGNGTDIVQLLAFN